MKKVLYINGDSWLSHYVTRVTNADCNLFKDIFVINHSVPGQGNINIIKRTLVALAELKKYNIKPFVCIGLSEVGRDLLEEFKLGKSNPDLTTYLNSVLTAEINILKSELGDYQHYICSAWTSSVTLSSMKNKSLIDFIEQDFDNLSPVYTVGNGIYNWLNDRSKILKFNKLSFIEAVENKQAFEQALLNNPYIDSTLHLGQHTCDIVYERFFTHVLSTLGAVDDNY
jgi:hypothetical protein